MQPHRTIILDIETDGLLDNVSRVWINGFLDRDTKEILCWKEGEENWRKVYDNEVRLVIGHNLLGYDLPVLEKVYGYTFPKHVKFIDTMILSQVLNYRRFPSGAHSLEAWGEYLKCPKGEHSDWSQYSEEMFVYWQQDLLLTEQVFSKLNEERRHIESTNPVINTYLKAEHAVSKWCAKAELHGWPFDKETATLLFDKMGKELEVARNTIMPFLGSKTIATDKVKGVVPEKFPKWTKNGCYHSHIAKWFGIDPIEGAFDEEIRLIDGPYCRVEFAPLSLDSSDDVKIFLFRHGWEPTEFNYKKVEDPSTGKTISVATSPKITEDSLEPMQGHGKLYLDFMTTRSRYGIIKTWLENVDSNEMLHGSCFTIGTPSMRSRHNIIVNVPSAEAPWGKEMRQLFRCKPGWKLIGCDSAGNQARGLAHYLQNAEFTNQLLHGDIHQFNADVATKIVKAMGIDHVVPRSVAKRILYAFLFGASGAKLWSYIFGQLDKTKGNKFKNEFIKAVPGFKVLLEKLKSIFSRTSQFGEGYIPGIGGNRIYCDSYHKLLVYLLQACEKATCSAAVMLTMERLEAENIPYIPVIFYHDEEDFMVPEEYSLRAAEIGRNAFKDGPKLFGIEIMDGESKIGDNWYDVH